MPSPILLAADNFTPPTRTPWGGRRIVNTYKTRLLSAEHPFRNQPVGESWEISFGPEFPSTLATTGEPLSSWAANHPSVLGNEQHAGQSGSALLVKLLDTDDELSVQVHPADGDPMLKPDESGKPESWFILDHQPGCGLYLGFKPGVKKQDVAQCLDAQGNLADLMNFIEVQAGDFFLIEAGMPHAIGRGITLVEPQRVLPGKRGVTYRYWDWNRTYDEQGAPSPSGKPRALHVDEALSVTQWHACDDPAWLSRIRCRTQSLTSLGAEPQHRVLSGTTNAQRPSRSLRVEWMAGTGTLQLDAHDILRGVVITHGALTIEGTKRIHAEQGQSLIIPAGTESMPLTLDHAHVIVSAIVQA